MESTSKKQCRNMSIISELGKLPPQSIESEEVVLGSILLDQSCIPTVAALLTPESFYKEHHKLLYSDIFEMYRKNETIDLITVVEKLKKSGNIELAGGAYAISRLTDRIASTANIEAHCRIIQEAHIKRVIINATAAANTEAYDHSSDPFDCLTNLERSITNISAIIASGGNMVSISTVLDQAATDLARREENYKLGKNTGISTGLYLLDKHTKGWQNGELIVLAGRPSMGKSALMLHFALHCGVNACIYSLEMPGLSLANRMILSVSGLDPGRFAAGAMTSDEWNQFYDGRAKLENLPMFIDDNSSVSTRYIKAHSKMMKDKGKCDIIFVDYLQLADMRSDQHGRNREQEVSQAAREFKIMAKTLNVPIILLSQLSRAVESRSEKKPMLSDLRESGAIEQDADIVLFAYRPEYYGITTDAHGNDMTGVGYINVAKGRNIGTSEIPFRYNPSMTNIYDFNFDNNNQPF